jgi:hypothetical protein
MKPLHLAGAAALVLALAAPAKAAGDVVVAVDPGTTVLRITGDGSDNDIAITPGAVTGEFVVTGRNGTTVNLAESGVFANVRTVVVSMSSGNDIVAVSDVRIRGGLSVRLGDGDDTVTLTGTLVRGRTVLRGGLGNDRLVAQGGATFPGTFTAFGGEGADTVEFVNSAAWGHTIVNTGSGDDTLTMQNSDFEDEVQIFLRAGNDTFLAENCDFEDDFEIECGVGDDHVTIDDCEFKRDVEVTGNSGDDDLSLHSGNDFQRVPRFRSFED